MTPISCFNSTIKTNNYLTYVRIIYLPTVLSVEVHKNVYHVVTSMSEYSVYGIRNYNVQVGFESQLEIRKTSITEFFHYTCSGLF